ncbi:MAG: acyl-CoA thioesterase [Gemmatimonadetes bacterium]|nr:acyl-CoA thioesterase [Gemmatimonadota bacterium]
MMRFQSEVRVRSYELDSLGHVNHAVYLNYFEQARWDALEAAGYPHTSLTTGEWGVQVVRIEAEYRKECRQGQLLHILTRVEELRSASVTLSHELRRVDDGPLADPAVTATVVLVWVGKSRRPIRIPPEARRALEGFTS